MGWKSQRSEAPFGQQTLDCFHVGQGLSELGYVETQRLKQSDFASTVDLLFRRRGERLFLSLYGLCYARRGFTPELFSQAYLARGWARLVSVGLPMVLLAAGLITGELAGRSAGLVVLVVGLVSWLWALLFSSDRFVREYQGGPPDHPATQAAPAHKV